MQQFLEQLVIEKRQSTKLVGLGAIVIQNDNVIGAAVSGERKKGSQVPLDVNDLWHIGSITKSFTATMIARLVEKGELSWNVTIKEIFCEADGLNSEWHDVTLEHLLTHTSGAPPNFPFLVHFKKPAEGVERMMARESAVLDVLKNKPQALPGSTFAYSNVGYTLAGVVAEKATGKPWEELINQEIFTPLQMLSGGFGAPQDIDKELEQPRGHRTILGFKMAAGPKADNTPIMGPAGTIHLSLHDLALYANEHLQGMQGSGSLLKAETFQRLHEPVLEDYAYGWVAGHPEGFGVEPVLWHNGSNRMWYALLAILPSINSAVVVTSNDGNIALADKGAREVIKQVAEALTMAP